MRSSEKKRQWVALSAAKLACSGDNQVESAQEDGDPSAPAGADVEEIRN
jgi:hypothetical protein